MANKAFSKMKGLLGSRGKEEQKDDQTLQRENREREQNMSLELERLLSDIEHSPKIKLPKSKMDEFSVRQRIALMLRDLENTRVTSLDESGLDQLIMGFIYSLRTALTQGYENMSYWASIALHHSAETLHIEVPQSDVAFAQMLYDRKFMYAETLKLVIEEARLRDEQEDILKHLTIDYNNSREELADRRKTYNAVQQSKNGAMLIQSTRQKANDPSSMTDEESELFDNLLKIRSLKDNIKTLAHQRNVSVSSIRIHDDAISKYRSQLRELPTVEDEKLAARMKEMDKYFLERLDARVGRTLAIAEQTSAYRDKLEAVASKMERFIGLQVAETIDQEDIEAVNRSMAQIENAQMASRIRDNQRQLERLEEMLRENAEELEREAQREIEREAEREIEKLQEEEQEQEALYETEEEFG